MTQYSILKMAREAGLLRGGDGWTMPHRWGITELERFAALIEQYLSYDGIHTCHVECQRPACVAVREAVKAERERCVLILERLHERSGGQYNYYLHAAKVLKGEI